MQGKEMMACVLLSVPLELIGEAGLEAGGVLQMSAADGRLIIENAEDAEGYFCDGDCEHCPLDETDCDGNCGACPCAGYCDESGAD